METEFANKEKIVKDVLKIAGVGPMVKLRIGIVVMEDHPTSLLNLTIQVSSVPTRSHVIMSWMEKNDVANGIVNAI